MSETNKQKKFEKYVYDNCGSTSHIEHRKIVLCRIDISLAAIPWFSWCIKIY